jgi:hypothetical protein
MPPYLVKGISNRNINAKAIMAEMGHTSNGRLKCKMSKGNITALKMTE